TNLGYINGGEKGAASQQVQEKQGQEQKEHRQHHQQPYVDHWMGLIPVIRLRHVKRV
ncbi:hypothetical protein BGZ97_005940, partial [Linnemannia gamsii]